MTLVTGPSFLLIKELNQHPLNQEAKRWLRLVPYSVEEECLYLLQLMWWGLEEASLRLKVQRIQALRETLLPVIYELMDYADQQAAWEFLTKGRVGELRPDDLPILSLYTLQHSMIPERAALWALASLDMIVSVEDNYGLGD